MNNVEIKQNDFECIWSELINRIGQSDKKRDGCHYLVLENFYVERKRFLCKDGFDDLYVKKFKEVDKKIKIIDRFHITKSELKAYYYGDRQLADELKLLRKKCFLIRSELEILKYRNKLEFVSLNDEYGELINEFKSLSVRFTFLREISDFFGIYSGEKLKKVYAGLYSCIQKRFKNYFTLSIDSIDINMQSICCFEKIIDFKHKIPILRMEMGLIYKRATNQWKDFISDLFNFLNKNLNKNICVGDVLLANNQYYVVISNAESNNTYDFYTVIPIRKTSRKECLTRCEINFQKKNFVAFCEEIGQVDKRSVLRYVGSLGPDEMAKIKECLYNYL